MVHFSSVMLLLLLYQMFGIKNNAQFNILYLCYLFISQSVTFSFASKYIYIYLYSVFTFYSYNMDLSCFFSNLCFLKINNINSNLVYCYNNIILEYEYMISIFMMSTDDSGSNSMYMKEY